MHLRILASVLIAWFAVTSSAAYAHEEGETVSPREGSESTHYVHMTDRGFEPSELRIKQGETVLFENLDDVSRWPASDIHPTHEIYSAFDPDKEISPGESWEFTFTRAGAWQMHDHVFPEFIGIVYVEEVPGFVDETAEEGPSVFDRVRDSLVVSAHKLYYRIFPSKLEKRLEGASFMEMSHREDELSFWMKVLGSEKVMEKILAESDGGNAVDCHTEAHKVGRIAYIVYGPEAFQTGDASCHSGFYHGAMEAMISEKGTDNLAEEMKNLCDEVFDTRFGVFECYHGVGHGVLAYKSYDLLAALDICATLPTYFEQRSCYGGAFMENVVAGRGGGAVSGHSTDWINETDPHFPCNAIGNDFQRVDECYLMQTSWMLQLANYDFASVANECMNAPDQYRHTCIKSLGRDAAGHSLRNPRAIVEYCSLVPDREVYLSSCISGGVNVIIDFWGSGYTNQAEPVCDLLPSAEKVACSALIEARMADLAPIGNES